MATGVIAKMQGNQDQDRLLGEGENIHAMPKSKLCQIKAIPTVHDLDVRFVETVDIGSAASVQQNITDVIHVLGK